MTKLLQLPDEALLAARYHGFVDHFDHLVTADRWTTILTDLGTASVGDAVGGILALVPSDGTVADNDETYVHSTNELFLFANDKPLWFGTRIQFTEANTDDANVLVGLLDAPAANSILDNGGGPPASYSGAVLYKVDGGTVWNFETSLAGTQTTTATTITAGGASYQTLVIEARSRDATTVELIPYIDTAGGQNWSQCKDANGNLIKHTITLGSPTEMAVFLGVKNGSANNETLNADWCGCFQLI